MTGWKSDQHSSTMDLQSFTHLFLTLCICSSVLIILTNLAMISAVLYSPLLRRRPRNMVILSIAFADLLMGSFVTPMYIRTVMETTVPDCHTTLALQVIGDHGIFFIVGWSMVTFNILHIKKMSVKFPWRLLRLPFSRRVKGIMLALWPWIAVMCILVPLIATSSPLRIYTSTDDVMCMFRLTQSTLIVAEFLSLYLPFYLCVAALVTMVVCYSKGCHQQPSATLMEDVNANPPEEGAEQQPDNDHDQEQAQIRTENCYRAPAENPLVASAPNAVYLVCYMPLIVLTWLHLSESVIPLAVNGVTLFGLLSRSYLLPFTWLLFRDINKEVHDYWQQFKTTLVLCISHPPPTSVSSPVSFSRLQETQTA